MMSQGSKSKYSDKQKREAQHIEEGYEERGVSEKEAKRRAWATVNKMHGGGAKGGSGTNEPQLDIRGVIFVIDFSKVMLGFLGFKE